MNRAIFQNMSSWVQLLFLCLLGLFGLVIVVFVMGFVMQVNPDLSQTVDFLRFSVLAQSVMGFLFPACVCVFLFQPKFKEYLCINKSIDLKTLFLCLILIVTIQPLVSFTAYYNDMLKLPESLSGLEQQMRAMEDGAKKTMEMLLTTDSVSILFLNILIIAVGAGVTEEFFFRGAMQQMIKKICVNKHVAIWITAFIFSAIHFQFYGFVPRMLLGALLGYMFVWSGNLWIPIIVHTVNNAMSTLIFHFYYGTPTYQKAESFGTGGTWWLTVVSIVVSGFVIFLLAKDYKEHKPEDVTL